MFVTGNVFTGQGRIGGQQGVDDLVQAAVLDVLIVGIVSAFQLDTDGKVIADLAAPIAGSPGMPGAAVEGYVLDKFPRSADEQVGDTGVT